MPTQRSSANRVIGDSASSIQTRMADLPTKICSRGSPNVRGTLLAARNAGLLGCTLLILVACGGATAGSPQQQSGTTAASLQQQSGTTASSPQPTISGISPTTGSVGSVITVTGTGFTGSNSAWIGSAHDAGISVVSDTQAQVTVPADAQSGQLAVLNSQHSAFSQQSFTVTAATTGSQQTSGSISSGSGASVAAPPASSGSLSIRVLGSHFVGANGAVVQLRGVNYSGFESVAIQGWDPADPSGAQAGQAGGPKWSAIQAWKANIVRIPLNEASWLGYTCTDTGGEVHNPDPGGNYKASVQTQVDQATAAGLYVILDLHWAAPGNACPMLQTQMADNDHSIAFWTSIAGVFKGYPNVLFELFNEPFLNFDFTGDPWAYMMKGTGGSFSGYPATGNTSVFQDVKQPWAIASYQAMINAVRATGATNVVLVGAVSYTQDLSGWLANRPSDPLNQMAATWHPYPTFGTTWGTAAYAQPNYAPGVFTDVQNILAAGIPVIATETGDQDSSGTVGAPLVSNVTQWADQNGVSVIGWAWDVWGDANNVLIKDVNGTPTDGYGQVFQSWLLAH